MENIRNFCIIAHIDHGKSTLADRMLELTGTIDKRHMKDQVLDQMDLERERGITIKLQPARMQWQGYILNLIDTPGHVDFSYEVSRSLAAVEGAILLVDASQGVEAQTLANLYLAIDQKLTIIPVINKIDLPAADVESTKQEIIKLLGCAESDILLCSAKTGQGVDAILDAVIARVSPPGLTVAAPQALIFDSNYDEYKGVIIYVRVFGGSFRKGDKIKFVATDKISEVLDLGFFKPQLVPHTELRNGEIGYLITGVKDLEKAKVGDTVINLNQPAPPLAGYKEIKPMVYAGIFPKEGDDYNRLREAILKLKLSDASLLYEPAHSTALGFGFRCGFLGLLHLEIFQERLRREFNLELVVTTPTVAYKVYLTKGTMLNLTSPAGMPNPSAIDYIEEPYMQIEVVSPKQYMGALMDYIGQQKGVLKNTEFLDEQRLILTYHLPLASILVDFYDNLKSISSGYASLNYDFADYRPCELVKMDILVAESPVEALATLVYKDQAHQVGKKIVQKLKEILPKAQFVIKLQAAVGGKVVAGERISAMRKDVTAKLYGGDVTRKRKLLEKQKKGKRRMAQQGKIDIPPEAYMAVLRR